MNELLKVTILNQEYHIKSDEDPAQVSKLEEYVNRKIDDISKGSKGLTEKKIAILLALNIAGEYFQLLKEHEELLIEIRKRSEKIISNIDSKLD
ncbi:MAG: cell division protein ZapA [Deltaproteobacteria bacterium]|nr:cell division protein ZapA [Deltaproteobacteria bacterium]